MTETSDWPSDDMLIEFARSTTPAQRLEWLESALDFASATGALARTLQLEQQAPERSGK